MSARATLYSAEAIVQNVEWRVYITKNTRNYRIGFLNHSPSSCRTLRKISQPDIDPLTHAARVLVIARPPLDLDDDVVRFDCVNSGICQAQAKPHYISKSIRWRVKALSKQRQTYKNILSLHKLT